LFRGSGNNDNGSAALANIPVIQPLDAAQLNSTSANNTNRNTTTTATVTIPVCDGVVGGPCLDSNTHTIIP